jgi:hypothetical protein
MSQQTKLLSIFLPPDPKTGKGAALTTHIDPDNPFEVEMADQLKTVAATYPSSIAEFFIRLNECIKAKP